MSKFSLANRPKGTRSTYRTEARQFCAKRDAALSRVVLSTEDINTIAIFDGLAPGLTAFIASNAVARCQFACAIADSVLHVREALPDLQFLHVTIIDDQFETSDQETVLEIKSLTDRTRKILGGITPHFIAGAELAVFANRTHPLGGKVISPHVHAVVWGYDIQKGATEVANRYNALITTGTEGLSAIDVELVRGTAENLERVVTYPYRASVRTKTVYKHPITGRTNVHESEKGDRPVRFLRQFQIHSMLQQDHLSFAGGDGRRIRNAALAGVHQTLALTVQRGSRRDQLEWIADFWREFMPRIGLSRFKMPIIVIR